MAAPRVIPVIFDGVWKAFRRGERHDSLRDLVPSLVRRAFGRTPPAPSDDDARMFWAVKDVSFAVAPGEALGVIGRNGAGKSTILKLLTRILKPTRGACAVHGRTGALIEVAAGFHPDLTGRENVFLQGAIMGMRRAEIAERFDAIVDFAGVERFIDTPVKRYSSGMNARLGFAIASHLRPDVLLIDEVLAVGDMAFQEKCLARMRQFKGEGVAIVFVSHHLPAVAHLCDRVLLMDHGAAASLGPPAAVIREYCGASATSEEADVAISATLEHEDRRAGGDVFAAAPGDRLRLEASVRFDCDVERATVGVVVWDLTRELYVYGASSDAVGVAPVRARRGETRTFDFSFEANVTRGLYAIEINVVDPDRHRFLGVARGLANFRVVEQISYDGVANLYLAGRERSAGRVLRAVGAAGVRD